MSHSSNSPRINVWPNGYWCEVGETELNASHMSDDYITIDPTDIEAVKETQKRDGLCIEELVEAGYLEPITIA